MNIIPKYQLGGIAQYFSVYKPINVLLPTAPVKERQTAAEKTATTKDKDDDKITLKDLLGLLKDADGLPNELSAVFKLMRNALLLSSMLGQDLDLVLSIYMSFKEQLSRMADNKKEYDASVAEIKKDGSLMEPAISIGGNLVYQKRDGSLGEVAVGTYLKNRDSFKIVSNAQFAKLRKYSSGMAFDTDYINTLDNAMSGPSFDKLVDELKGTISSQSFKYNTLVDTDKILKGLLTIANLTEDEKKQVYQSMIKGGVYNIKVSDKNNLQNIQAAINYMASVLPLNAKVWAAYKTNIADTLKATLALLAASLLGMSLQDRSIDIDYEGDRDSFKSTKEKSGSDKDSIKATWLTQVQNGYGGLDTRRTLNPGSSGSLVVRGTYYGGIMDTKGDIMQDATVADVMSKSGLSGISDNRSIYFGNTLINGANLSQVAILNTGAVRIILPCEKDGIHVRPKLELVDAWNRIIDEVNTKFTNATPKVREQEIVKRIAKTPALHELLTANGKLDPNKYSAFIVADGLASSDNFEFNGSDKYIKETDDPSAIDYFKKVVKPEDYDNYTWYNPLDAFGNYTHLYLGSVYIPISTNNPLAAILYSGLKVSRSDAHEEEELYQKFNKTIEMGHVDPRKGWQ